MSLKPEWMAHRHAYTPDGRLVILLAVVATPAIQAVVWVAAGPLPPFVGLGVGAFVGWLLATVVWRRWRRRHPILATEERARREAPWN